MSLAKQVLHVGLGYWCLAALAGLHMQVHKLIIDLRHTRHYFSAFDHSHTFTEFAFKISPFATPLKS